jgi:hypothetical protein
MRPASTAIAIVGVCAGLLALTGCGEDGSGTPSPTISAPAPSPTPTPSPTPAAVLPFSFDTAFDKPIELGISYRITE